MLPSSESTKFTTSNEETLTLKINAVTSSGSSFTDNYSDPVEKLVKYNAYNRYNNRTVDAGDCWDDPTNEDYPVILCGGDDWVRPSVKTMTEHFTGVLYNDFSNMNGGWFPPHNSHRLGEDVDVRFTGNVFTVDADSAQRLVDYLNDPTYGKFIEKTYVTFTPDSEFGQKINEVDNQYLDDGCRTDDIIQKWKDHDTHFHWKFGFEPKTCDTVIDPIPPVSGDWQIIEDTIIRSSVIAPENIIVSNDAKLVIANGASLDVDLVNYHINVESGSGILIKSGSKIS